MSDRRNRDVGQKRARPRFTCGCFLCAPPRRQETDRDRMRAELDRLGIPHNMGDKEKKS